MHGKLGRIAMGDHTNVLDVGARAALERSRRSGFLLTELDGVTIKSIFDAACIDCRVDSDGDCVVRDEVALVASADPMRTVIGRSYSTTTGWCSRKSDSSRGPS
jgi:hypothetical protein